jgi:hypothetical protein
MAASFAAMLLPLPSKLPFPQPVTRSLRGISRFAGIHLRKKGDLPLPCLLILLALLIPRVVIILLWLFTYWFSGLFATGLVPVLGFIFLPTTLLWYTATQHWWHGVWTAGPVIGLIVAFLIDVSPHRGGWRRKRI